MKLPQTARLATKIVAALCYTLSTNLFALSTVQDGSWGDPATWGGTVPAFSTSYGSGDNLAFHHAVTVSSNETVSVRDLNLRTSQTGSIAIAQGGTIYLNWDVNIGENPWDSSAGYVFNLGARQIRFWKDGSTWEHNGTLDLAPGGADLFVRGPTNADNTLTGSGTVSLDKIVFGVGSGQVLNIDRNVTANTIDLDGVTQSTINLISGTTQTEVLDGLSATNTIHFIGLDAVLTVLASNFDTTAAQTAIANGFITVSGETLDVSSAGDYTVISVTPQGSTMTVTPSSVVNPYYLGTGIETDLQFYSTPSQFGTVTQDDIDYVIEKRFKESRPSIVRFKSLNITFWEPTEGNQDFDSNVKMQDVYANLDLYQETDTDVYLTLGSYKHNPAWLGGGYLITDSAIQDKFARTVVDMLVELIENRGYTNIKWFCINNEGATKEDWAWFFSSEANMQYFKAHNQKIRDELAARGKSGLVQILTPDVSSLTVQNKYDVYTWFLNNADSVSDIYGGHAYHQVPYNDLGHYDYLLNLYSSAAADAATKGKGFILGEFGGKSTPGEGAYYYTTEPQNADYYGLQLAEHAIAAMNAGIDSPMNWSLTDLYYDRAYKWGLYAGVEEHFQPRDPYFGYALLMKFFNREVDIISSESNDSDLHVVATQNPVDGRYRLAVVNRGNESKELTINITGGPDNARFQQYEYSVGYIPYHPFADLPRVSTWYTSSQGSLVASIPAQSMAVIIQSEDRSAPAEITGLTKTVSPNSVLLTWDASAETDHDYYRVYRELDPGFIPGDGNQIISTYDATYTDDIPGGAAYSYKVVAVDTLGNTRGANLLVNPGFENDPLSLWDGNPFTTVNNNIFKGAYAAELNSPNNNWNKIFQEVASDPGVIYDVSGWMKNTSGQALGLFATFYNNEATVSGNFSAERVASTTYVFTRKLVVAPSGANKLRATYSFWGTSGTAYFDELAIVEVDSNYILSQGSGFEDAATMIWGNKGVRVAESPASGHYAYKLTRTSPSWDGASQTLTGLLPNKAYTVNVKVKCAGGATAAAYIRFYDSNGVQIDAAYAPSTTDTVYTPLAITRMAPAATSYAIVSAYLVNSAGTLYIDDFEVTMQP